MDEAIIAKIARAIADPGHFAGYRSDGESMAHWTARALLPLVGEEMAKIAEGQTFTEDNDMYWNGWNDALEHVVEAIRQSTGATS